MATANAYPVYPVGTQDPPVGSINDDVVVPARPTVIQPPVIKIHQTDKDDTCAKSCSNGIYSFFSALFCFKKNQSLLSKLGVTWLWTFLIPIAVGLFLGLYIFAPYSFLSSPGDQRKVMGRYDSFFCDAIRVDSAQLFDAYLLGHSPAILQNNRSYTTVNFEKVNVPEDSYAVWDFYLLEGSVLVFQICNTKRIEFFMLKGKGNYKKWKKNANNCNCAFQHVSYPNQSTECAKTPSEGSKHWTHNFTASIGSTDDYYLVFQNPSDLDSNQMNINIQVNRSTYNIYDKVRNSCRDYHTCDLSLSLFSSDSFVYVSKDNNTFNVENKVYCNPTWAVYLAMFGGIPMIIGFSVSLTLFILTMHCPGAWESEDKPNAWDQETTQKVTPSILDTLPQDKPKEKKNKKKKNGKKTKKNGKLFGNNASYDTLSEEESEEESMETLPRNSPPPSYSDTLSPIGEQPGNQIPAAVPLPQDIDSVATVEVHAIPE